MPDREIGGRFNPGGAPRGDDSRRGHPRRAGAPLSLTFDFPDAPDIAPSPSPSAIGGRRPATAPADSPAPAPAHAAPSPADDPDVRALASDPAAVERLLQRLQLFGLRGISALRLTRNRSTLVSFRAGTLRLHAAFERAPDDILRAVAVFVTGRGAARAAARRLIVAYPIPRDATPRRARSERLHPDDQALADRLREAHARLNQERFGGTLTSIRLTVSRRMSTRLGHYAPERSHPGGAEIAISRRHIRRHGWREAFDTLLHEMVHQWQEENGHPIDHGARFRQKARDVGTTPRARRVLR